MPITNTTNPISVTGEVIGALREITNSPTAIQSVLWYGVTTAGHLLSLKDKDGNVILKMGADAPGTSGKLTYYMSFPKGLSVNGIYCDDMDSGELYIYRAI